MTGQMRSDRVTGIELPASALARNQDGKPAVWVIDDKTNTVSLRPIEVSAYGTERIQVSSGLQNGEKVITAGAQTLRPGQQVKLLGNAS